MALSQWQEGLSRTRLDTDTIRHIIELELAVVDKYDRCGVEFVDFLMSNYDAKKTITPEDLKSAYQSAFHGVIQDINTPYAIYHNSIINSGRAKAVKDLGMNREARRRIYRTAAIDDRYVQDSLEKAFTHVKTVGDDVINQLEDKWKEVGGSNDIIKDLLLKDEDALRDENITKEQLKYRLHEIWQDKRYLLERIVRTETINTHARAQLQEWYDQGVREVERNEVNDIRTCALCRELGQPGNVYEIEKLLNGEYSSTKKNGEVITSAEYPISYNSHPNCRGSYSPRVNWAVFDEFEKMLEQGNEGEFQNASDVVAPEATAQNVPIEYQSEVKQALEDFGPDYGIKFVPEITDDPEWQNDRLEELRQYYPEGEAQSRLSMEKSENRGQITQYTTKSGKVLVSGDAGDVNRIVIPVLREHAHQVWTSSDADLRKWVEDRYKVKMDEMGYSLSDEKQGIQIYGDTPFVSPVAMKSPEDYFAESYAAYVADPTKLLFFDEKMYDYLRANFIEKEYIARGGLN